MIKLKNILTEQSSTRQSIVAQSYSNIVAAVKNMKRDPKGSTDKILAAIKMLKTRNEVENLMKRFQDGKTGYMTFEQLINNEYKRFIASVIKKLIIVLNERGLIYTASYHTNEFGQQMFSGGFEYIGQRDMTQKCEITDDVIRKYNSLLPKAIQFWKSWLSDPVTKSKIQKNWDVPASVIQTIYRPFNKISLDIAYSDYFKLLDNLKIEFYHCAQRFTKTGIPLRYEDAGWTYAFVSPTTPNIIYVNASNYDPGALDTMIHEIQHLLYYIKPLNPTKLIKSVFVNKQSPAESPNSIKKTLSASNKQLRDVKIIATSKKYDIDVDVLKQWKTIAMSNNEERPGYVCRETEKMSNIMAMRKHLGVKPADNITVSMILPYIRGIKNHTDVSWFIQCWILNGFGDLQQLLNRTNQLAVTTVKTKNVG